VPEQAGNAVGELDLAAQPRGWAAISSNTRGVST